MDTAVSPFQVEQVVKDPLDCIEKACAESLSRPEADISDAAGLSATGSGLRVGNMEV